MRDPVPFVATLLVVETQSPEGDVRVITRVAGRLERGAVGGKEVGMVEAEGLGLGIARSSAGGPTVVGVLAWPQEEEESQDGHVLDATPLAPCELRRRFHGTELEQDVSVDGPESVGRRIFSGKGLEHVLDGVVVATLDNGAWEIGRVHQVDDLLADGTDVFSHRASSDGLVIGVAGSFSDDVSEGSEEGVSFWDPNESATDFVGCTVSQPLVPHRGL